MESLGQIAFVGAGKMATGIVGGLLAQGYPKEDIKAFDISDAAASNFNANTGLTTTTKLSDAINGAKIVFLAVKPVHVQEVLSHSAPLLKDKLLISIAAGIKLDSLIKYSDCKRVIRVMPNVPALVGMGASAFACSNDVTDEEAQTTENIFNCIGIAYEVEEKLLDAVTGLSGSGPAYVFDFIQGLADGAVNAGLPRALAQKLAAQTVMGAAKMVLETNSHPCELKDQVTSPGGTTARGLATLEKGAFRGIVGEAVIQSANRSIELGKKD